MANSEAKLLVASKLAAVKAVLKFFEKDEIEDVCQELNIKVRNIPDVPYTYRVRRELPNEIAKVIKKHKDKIADQIQY